MPAEEIVNAPFNELSEHVKTSTVDFSSENIKDFIRTANEQWQLSTGTTESPFKFESGETKFGKETVTAETEMATLLSPTQTENVNAVAQEGVPYIDAAGRPERDVTTRRQVEEAQRRREESASKLEDFAKQKGLDPEKASKTSPFTEALLKIFTNTALAGIMTAGMIGLLASIAAGKTGCYAVYKDKSDVKLTGSGKDDCVCSNSGITTKCGNFCRDYLGKCANDFCDAKATFNGSCRRTDSNNMEKGVYILQKDNVHKCMCVSRPVEPPVPDNGEDVILVFKKYTWQTIVADTASQFGYYFNELADAGIEIVKAAADAAKGVSSALSSVLKWLVPVLCVAAVVLLVLLLVYYLVIKPQQARSKQAAAAKSRSPSLSTALTDTSGGERSG